MYNTSGTVPSLEGVLAAINDRPAPYWETQSNEGSVVGVKLTAEVCSTLLCHLLLILYDDG